MEILRSLAHGFSDLVRHNKLASALSAIAFILGVAFAFHDPYDERPRYRERILPEIERLEARFFESLRDAENAPNETWRLQYFLNAHLKALDVLKFLKSRRPATEEARRAHAELIRYYELVDEQFAIIRTEMSVKEALDYMSEWKEKSLELKPIRDRWLDWLRR